MIGRYRHFAPGKSAKSASIESRPLVAFVLPTAGIGGAEIVNITLIRQLVEMGLAVDLVVGREETRPSLPKSTGYVQLNARKVRGMLVPLARYLQRRKPAAIIGSMWPLTVVCVAARALARSDARLAVWEHSHISSQYEGKGLLHRTLLKRSIALTYPLADVQIAVSQDVADDLAALSGIERSQITVLNNPITLPETDDNPNLAAAADRAWKGWDGPRILTVGMLKPAKNHALLIRAFRRLLEIRDARLMIVGDGELREETLAAARREGVAEKTFMPGIVADPTAYYRSADLFVLSSAREGLPCVVIEALACGIPVVSTNCKSGPAEILENGRYGRLVPIDDVNALANAMNEDLMASHDPDRLKLRADDFLPSKIADQLVRLLFANGPAHASVLSAMKAKSPAFGGS